MFQHGDITEYENGEKFVTLEVGSNLLAHLNVDTYSCFNGDSWVEQELEHFGSGESEAPYDSDNYDDYEWNYDHAAILKDLAEASASNVLEQLSHDGIIESIEVQGVDSPREYNFITDSYTALWTLNLTKLDGWAAENNFNAEEYLSEFHGSRSGFMSFVPSWFRDAPEDTTLWLKLDAYLRAELDTDSQFYAVAEAEWEAYENNVSITRNAKDSEG
jgi:hypothetical protein